MKDYLNVIQLVCGVLAAIFVFSGLFMSMRKLNKEDSTQMIPKKSVIRSMIFIGIGLLLYTGVKTCTYYANSNDGSDIYMIYSASLVDVVKYFGFIILLPLLFNYIKRRPVGKETEYEGDGNV